MGAGYNGTFVISWSQTEVDGLDGAPLTALTVGAAWSWRGDAVRVDGPNNILRLDGANGSDALRKRAACMVQRLVGQAFEKDPPTCSDAPLDEDMLLRDRNFVVTDGAQSYSVTLIETGTGCTPLLMFVGTLPPRNSDLWVVHHSLGRAIQNSNMPDKGGVICFTPGTRIQTPHGPCFIEDLRPGDKVHTKDNGIQEIQWTGARRMTGARLFAMPELRPVRIRAGALGKGQPNEELLVSPGHRILFEGAAAMDLFNTPEILIAAKDLVNGDSVVVDYALREVTYVHMMFERHQVVWANGIETDSFHPANTALSTLSMEDRAELLHLYPELQSDPHLYGAFARRNLNTSEAAIFHHAA